MDTGPVVRFTRSILGRARNLLGLSTWDGITLIPHQANARLLAAMRKEAKGATWFHNNGIATIGNTLNASTLFELDAAIHRDEIGNDIVLLPFGAEWTYGVIRLKVMA